MKILITGTRGIGKSLSVAFTDHEVLCVSRSTGHDIHSVKQWGPEFLTYDMVINNAYDGFGQILVLQYFYYAWRNEPSKKIISIGSRSSYMSSSDNKQPTYWPYQIHKLALQEAHDRLIQDAKCDMKIINPGPVDTEMISHLDVKKMSPNNLAQRIVEIVQDPDIKRVDLWL